MNWSTEEFSSKSRRKGSLPMPWLMLAARMTVPPRLTMSPAATIPLTD